MACQRALKTLENSPDMCAHCLDMTYETRNRHLSRMHADASYAQEFLSNVFYLTTRH